MSPTIGDTSRRENAQNAAQNESSVQQLQRESGDGASANPTESESTSAYQRRTKKRTGSLFDDDEDDAAAADDDDVVEENIENADADQPEAATTN